MATKFRLTRIHFEHSKHWGGGGGGGALLGRLSVPRSLPSHSYRCGPEILFWLPIAFLAHAHESYFPSFSSSPFLCTHRMRGYGKFGLVHKTRLHLLLQIHTGHAPMSSSELHVHVCVFCVVTVAGSSVRAYGKEISRPPEAKHSYSKHA